MTNERPNLRVVKPRKPIPGGVTCGRCGHERFPYMKTCPRCEDTVMRELDTSTNELTKIVAIGFMLKMATIARMAMS